ncbi:MAG: hypothetical protein Q8N88_04365 [Nanoarchaeota archaeon]|nr:hypothetical protein [Nanoarchaeota archaeon]
MLLDARIAQSKKTNLLLGTSTIMNQLVPITDFKRNLSDVMQKLEDFHSLYIMKNSTVMAVMMQKETVEEIKQTLDYQNDYIVKLQNELAIAEYYKNPIRISHDSVMDKFEKAKNITQPKV